MLVMVTVLVVVEVLAEAVIVELMRTVLIAQEAHMIYQTMRLRCVSDPTCKAWVKVMVALDGCCRSV
jgi:hypothetical protein